MNDEFTLVSDSSAAMTAVAETTALVYQNDYLFIAYTSSNLEAFVSSFHISTSTWQRTILGSNLNDAHNGTSIGIDSDGYLHACWNLHNSTSFLGHYKRSIRPYDISEMIDWDIDTLGQSYSSHVSYARFYQVGYNLFLLYRVGFSSAGNEYVKKWDRLSQQWVDVAIPFIDGLSLSPTDNPYLGCGIGSSDNPSLHLIWTHRTSYYNSRVVYVKYDLATNQRLDIEGNILSLPLNRNSVLSITDPSDSTISNSGLGLVVINEYPHIVYRRHINGYAEVFYAYYDILSQKWVSTQLSLTRLPRLRMCLGGPQEEASPPRPCDIELQGPFIVALTSGRLCVIYGRSVGQKNPAWQRPSSILYAHLSDDNGQTWSGPIEVKRPVDRLLGDLIRETNGQPLLLAQELSKETGTLWIWDLDKSTLATYPLGEIVDISTSTSIPTIVPGSFLPSSLIGGLSISAWVRPSNNLFRMGVVDRGGSPERRQFRLLLWAGDGPTAVDKTKIQVLLGGLNNWSLVWKPDVEVNPNEWTHLVVVKTTVETLIYRNGVPISSMQHETVLPSVTSDMVIGGNYTSTNTIENSFSGDLEVKIFPYSLSANQVKSLYDGR